jgi:hypothetical protein
MPIVLILDVLSLLASPVIVQQPFSLQKQLDDKDALTPRLAECDLTKI